MENTTEKNLPVRNLERISEQKFKTYAAASEVRGFTQVWKKGEEPVKSKIFARNDGTFDLVFYRKIVLVGEKIVASMETTPAAEEPKKQHGLTAKERRAKEKRK